MATQETGRPIPDHYLDTYDRLLTALARGNGYVERKLTNRRGKRNALVLIDDLKRGEVLVTVGWLGHVSVNPSDLETLRSPIPSTTCIFDGLSLKEVVRFKPATVRGEPGSERGVEVTDADVGQVMSIIDEIVAPGGFP